MINQRWMGSITAIMIACGAMSMNLVAAEPAATPTAAPAAKAASAKAPAATPVAAKTLPLAVPAGSPEKVTATEGFTEYKLANGMQVVLFPDQSKPTIVVNVTVRVGSRDENYGETGMAHLLEHLLFKGTPKNPDIDSNFNKRGMRSNGSTWLDRTNYFETFQASDENLEWAIQMEADRLVNSFVAKKDLDSEMTVVRNEYERGENDPAGALIKSMQSVAYDWHNYGNSTIGNRSDIENVKIENLQAFYRMYYQPDNATLLVAGKFDEAKVLALVQKYFGAIPKPTRKLPVLWTVEPTQDGERMVTVRRKGDIQYVMLGYKLPSALNPDSGALSVLSFVQTNSPSGRLHKALVETGKAAEVFGFTLSGKDGCLQIFGAVVKKGEAIGPVQDELIKLVEEFKDTTTTAEELDRAKKNFANTAERTLNNHEILGVRMSDYIAYGDWRTFFLVRDNIQAVTADQVKEAAGKYFRRDNRVVGLFQPEDNPQRAVIPAAVSAAEALKNFKPKAAVAEAEAFDPSQANIDARTKRIQIGGLKVALLSKKTRGETVYFDARFHSGDEKSLFGKSSVRSMTGAMLSRGTTKYTRAQLKDEFTKLKVAGGVSGLGAGFQTTKLNLVEAIKLAALVMKEPSFPESEFQQLVKQELTGLEEQKSEPQSLLAVAMGKHFNTYPKGDVRYASDFAEEEEEIKAVTLQQLKDFHKAFYAANTGEISVVGDFDEAAVIQAIKEAFGDWKGGMPYTRITRGYSDAPAVNKAFETPDKANAVFSARISVNMQDEDPDYPALYIANYILGGGAGFESRLTKRIRVKDGLSYGVGSRLSVSSRERGGSWSVFAISAPQNTAKVEAAMQEELARALKDGFTEAELTSAKSGALQQRAGQRAQDSGVAGTWVSYLELGRTFAFNKAMDDKIQALKVEDLNAALRKYIDPAKLTIMKAGDFAKGGAAK